MYAGYDALEGSLWLALGRLCRSQPGGHSRICVDHRRRRLWCVCVSSATVTVLVMQPGPSSMRTAEGFAEMSVARWRVAALGLGEALPRGGELFDVCACVRLQVIFLFDSAVSFDEQQILEKLSASCVRCTHMRL